MRRVLKSKKGYTLTEMIVVMGIIGVMLLITFGGYNGIKREKYVQHVASLSQSQIRGTFIDVLSTKEENLGDAATNPCFGRSPQIKAVRVQLGANITNPITKVPFCDDATGTLRIGTTETVDSRSALNYSQAVQLTEVNYSISSGFLYFVFVSPYGEFFNYYASGTDPTAADLRFFNLGGADVGWSRGTDLIYAPKGGRSGFGPWDLKIRFDSDNTAATGILHEITVSKNGNAKLD